jgi:hypothetical protein
MTLSNSYFGNYIYTGADLELCEIYLNVKMYKSATYIEFVSDTLYKVPTSENVTLTATLATGYVENSYAGYEKVVMLDNEDGFVIEPSNNRDSVKITFNDASDNGSLTTYLNSLGKTKIAEVLNIAIFKTCFY